MDGVAYYDTSVLNKKYETVDSTNATWSVATGEGRFGSNCIKRVSSSSGNTGYIGKSPLMTQSGAWSAQATGIFGCAFKIDSLASVVGSSGPGDAATYFLAVFDTTGQCLTFSLQPDGTFSADVNGFGGVRLGISAQGIKEAAWYYVEIKWKIHASTGYVVIRVNGVTILNLTNINTVRAASTSTWNSIRFGALTVASVGSMTYRFRDVYGADTTGSGADVIDFLGDGVIDYITANGVGNVNDWTPSTGANWQNVDEKPQSTTDYNASSTLNNQDLFTMENVTAGAIIPAYQWVGYAVKQSAGSASIKPTLRIGGVNYQGNEQGVADSNYTYLFQPYDKSPATGAKLTEAEANAMESGYLKSV